MMMCHLTTEINCAGWIANRTKLQSVESSQLVIYPLFFIQIELKIIRFFDCTVLLLPLHSMLDQILQTSQNYHHHYSKDFILSHFIR